MAKLSSNTTSIAKKTSKRRFDVDSLYVRNSSFYVDANTGLLKLNYQPPTIDPDPSDEIQIVLPEEAWRPDIFAARIYQGRYNLARMLMRANKLFHVSEFQSGLRIRCPSLSRIQGTVV